MQRQLEPEIKAATLNYLVGKGFLEKEQTVINEFTLDGYSRRVDLVLASHKHLIAIEIKSEADSLQRLSGQTSKYLEYFDKVIIVAASKHIENILNIVPQNVAVWEICGEDIQVKQRGKIVTIKDKTKFLDLMKARELLKLASKLGITTSSRSRRSAEQVLERASLKNLRQAAIENLKERYSLTSSFFWERIQKNEIAPQHIDLLSPYKDMRTSQKEAQKENELFWENLSLQQNQGRKMFGRTPKHIQRLLAA